MFSKDKNALTLSDFGIKGFFGFITLIGSFRKGSEWSFLNTGYVRSPREANKEQRDLDL